MISAALWLAFHVTAEPQPQVGSSDPHDHAGHDHAGHGHAGHDHAGHGHEASARQGLPFELHDYDHPAEHPAYDLLAGTNKPRHEREALITTGILQSTVMAEVALSQHEPQLAEGLYRGALMECWLALGSIELAADRLAEAKEALDRAASSMAEPNRVTRLSLALIRLWTDEVDAAVEGLRRLSEERPRNLVVRTYYTHALAAAGREADMTEQLELLREPLPEIVTAIETLFAETENDPEARLAAFRPRLNVGILYHESPEELSRWRHRVHATRALILDNLAVLHQAAGRAERARTYELSAEAVELPEGTDPLPITGLRRAGLPPAVAPLSIAAGMLWKTATIELLDIVRQANAGELEGAETALRNHLETARSGAATGSSPVDLAAVHDMLGIIRAELGKPDQAAEHFLAALALEPEFAPDVREHLARLHWTNGRVDEAKPLLRSAFRSNSLARDLLFALAEIELAEPGRDREARAVLQAAVQQYRSPRALLALARLDARLSGPETGIEHLVQARGLAPSSEEILAELARLSLLADLPEQAIPALESLRRMHPTVAEYRELLARLGVTAAPEVGALRQAVEQAEHAAQQDEPQIAESHYRAVLREGWNLLGLLAVLEDELETARDAFERSARSAAVGGETPRRHLVLVDYRLGPADSALHRLRSLTTQYRSDPLIWEALIRALVAEGRTDELEEQMADLRIALPATAAALEDRLQEVGETEEARQSFGPRIARGPIAELEPSRVELLRAEAETAIERAERALEASARDGGREHRPSTPFPESAPGIEGQALALLRGGEIEEARGMLRRLQKQGLAGPLATQLVELLDRARNGSVSALLELVRRLGEENADKAKIALLTRAVELAPSSEEVLAAWTRHTMAAELHDLAIGALESLVTLFPESAEYSHRLGEARLGVGAVTEATEALQAALALDSERSTTRRLLARALNEKKRYVEARDHLLVLLEGTPNELGVIADLAVAEEGMGELESAERRARHLITIDPDHAIAHLVLGMVQVKARRWDEAREVLERALAGLPATSPEAAKAHYQLGTVCMRLGDREAARRHREAYERALEGPDGELILLEPVRSGPPGSGTPGSGTPQPSGRTHQ